MHPGPHAILTAGSTLLTLIGLAGMWLLSRKKAAGWAIAIGSNVLWIPYDLYTGQLGFLLMTAVSVPIAVAGWQRFRRDAA